jgi:potassium efflux system protein
MMVSFPGISGARLRVAAVSLAACLAWVPGQAARAQGGAGSGAAASESAAPAEPRVAETDAAIAVSQALGEEWAVRAAEFARARQRAPDDLVAIEAEVAKLRQRKAPRVEADRELAELETEMLGHEQDLALARKEAAAIDAEAAGRAERRRQIPELLAAAKERLRVFGAEVEAPAGDLALVEARQRLAQARRRAIEHEIAAYEAELSSYDARGQLLTLRRERAVLRVAALEEEVSVLREALAARRQGEAEVAAEEAQLSFDFADGMPETVLEVVRGLAEENRELALRRTGAEGLLQKLDETSGKLARAEAQVAEVSAAYERVRRNVEAAGKSGSVGVLLRKARSDVPDVGMYRRFIRMRRDQISQVQVEQIGLVERRWALDDVDAVVEPMLAEFAGNLSPGDLAAVEAVLRNLVETRQRYLDTLIAETEAYFQKLVDFDVLQQELVKRSDSLARYIDERVLWMPSGAGLTPALAADARDGLAWLLAPRYWAQVRRTLAAAFFSAPLVFTEAALLLLALPFAWPRLRAQVVKLGEQARASSCIRTAPTAAAFLLSLLAAIWGPGLLAFLGWRLGISAGATQFVRCFASGLLAAAAVWVTLLLPRQLLRPGGIAEAHLAWPAAPARDLRRELRWLTAVALPAVFAIAIFEARGEEAWREAIGRLAFLSLMAALLVFTHRVLREDAGAMRRIVSALTKLSASRWAWRSLHGLGLACVVGLAAAAARGYYWTSLQLATSLHVTLFFLFLVVIVHQLGTRWLLVASRRLALRRWSKAQADRQEQPTAEQDAPAPALAEPEVDLATVDEHTGRLLRNAALLMAVVCIWAVWVDLLPAAGALRSVELWKTNATVIVEMTNAAGELISSVEDSLVPVTLADVLLAIVLAAATFVLARNLPGLLEISVFRQLRTSAGERYAYTTISKYGVTVAGVAAALNAVGVGWSSIQWLLAAVGIGLGFGLQEIFANFVSGLIILFERPIRVGDTVTVGDVSGTVTKIRIRATWITGFDRKELVVPNKEFITNRLVNWSLSDAVLRVEIPVGIAYGSDTAKAKRVLEEVAARNEHVLAEPPPFALFRGFGESSLDFELRVFSPDINHYVQIKHELHMEIDHAFRAEGIEIAFPQRDLHVRSMPVARREAAGDPRD